MAMKTTATRPAQSIPKAEAAEKPTEDDVHDKQILKSAPPPWHTQLLVVSLFLIFALTFPSTTSIDRVATTETFSRVMFPQLLSVEGLACIRLVFGLIPFCTTIINILFDDDVLELSYLPGSKLHGTELKYRGYLIPSKRPGEIVGFATVTSFTKWSFFLLGVSFVLTGMIPLMALHGIEVPSWMLRTALLMFECAGPTALMVAVVVRYAIWPMALKAGTDTSILQTPRALMEHNGNVAMVLIEVALLGGLPIRPNHFSVAPLFGCVYVLFAWYASNKWAPKRGPQFLYFFLDTTLGWKTSVFLLALLAVLSTFYGVFCLASAHLRTVHGGAAVHATVILILCSLVCRLRD